MKYSKDLVIEKVQDYYGGDIFGKKYERGKFPQRVAMFLLYKFCLFTDEKAGQVFGVSHGCSSYARTMVAELYHRDEKIKKEITEIEMSIKGIVHERC